MPNAHRHRRRGSHYRLHLRHTIRHAGPHRGFTISITRRRYLPFLRSFTVDPVPRRLCLQLIRPLLTSRSGLHRRPFRHEARSPQVRTHSFITQPPDLRRLTLGHKSFAVFGPLALVGSAFYPVLVHGQAIYAPRLPIPHSVALMQLRLHFACCDQLTAGLAPAGVHPCWAHKKKPRCVSTAGLPGELKLSCWHQASAGIRSCEPGPGRSSFDGSTRQQQSD